MKGYLVLVLLSALGCTHVQNSSTDNHSADTDQSISAIVKDTVAIKDSLPPKQDTTVKNTTVINTQTNNKPPLQQGKFTGPAAIVYKTKADYYDKVPVT